MPQTWLRPNRRALLLGMILPGLTALLAFGLAWGLESRLLRGVALAVGCAALVVVIGLVWHLRLPRIGFQDGQLWFYLRGGTPLTIPAEVVECFFIGQGPTLRPRGSYPDEQTVTVVVRLAERAKEYHQRDVKPALGSWCDGYIILRGTWCEPLNGDVVNALNHRLAEVHRAQRAARQESV